MRVLNSLRCCMRGSAFGVAVAATSLTGCFIDRDALAGGHAAGRVLNDSCAASSECATGLLCARELCALPRSCVALHEARPELPSNTYEIQPDATELSNPLHVFCDMTNDGGGWLRIEDESWIRESREAEVTVVNSTTSDGLSVDVFANAGGCGGDAISSHVLLLADRVPWREVRFRQLFVGQSACYSIFGNGKRVYVGKPNLLELDPAVDVLRDQVKMGTEFHPRTGEKLDTFDGRLEVCGPPSFWNPCTDLSPRSAVVSLRRERQGVAAGPGTGVNCNTFGEGESSPTWWRYSEIYVR